MGRKLRHDDDGLWHHVFNRGASHLPIFNDDADRHLFLALVVKAARRHNVEIHAYCLMGNHYHLLVHTPVAGMSAMMQYAMSIYTRRFNLRQAGRDGALFRGRFENVHVTNDDQLIVLGRYIHRNPDFLCAGDLAGYKWSSYAVYAGRKKAPSWLKTATLLGHFNNDRTQYRAFVEVPTFASKRAS